MISEILSSLVRKTGKTQKQIAFELGLTQQRFNFYLSGKREPDFDTLSLIANYFEVTTDFFINGDTKKISPPPEDDELTKISKIMSDPLNVQLVNNLKALTPLDRAAILAQMEALIKLRSEQ